MMKRRVVVTGCGVVTPLSCQVDEFWRKILAGESGVHRLRRFDTEGFKVTFGGDVYDWDPSGCISKKDIKRVDLFTQFALVAGAEAISDSGLDFSKENAERCGVIVGSGIGGLQEIETQTARLLSKGPDRVSAMTIPKLMLNAAGGHLSIAYGLKGLNYSIATACASATNALGNAFRSIQYNDADIIIAGGAEAAVTKMGMSGFANMRALSMRNDDPPRASRPFDLHRDGFVLSEGAGLLIFEELEHAKARGAEIYCEVLGGGASGDAGHITSPNEEGAGAGLAMKNALQDAGLNPSDVCYINAHGTSTPLGDKAETRAVKSVFGDHAYKLNISSTKSQIGHSLGASGGIELVATVKALLDGVAPPTINLETPDPECDLNYTPNAAQERPLKVCMSNSFGFGGHNASIIIGKLRNAAP